jgi:hypothetical protein
LFCSLTSLLSRTPDPKDVSKVQIRILAFLQSEKTAVTALVKLLPPSHAFLSGSWKSCEGCLSGHELHEGCVQSKSTNTNDWMSLLKIRDSLQYNIARHKARKVCYYISDLSFYSSLLCKIAANHNDDSVLLLAFSNYWFVVAWIALRNSNSKFEFEAKPQFSARWLQGAAYCSPPVHLQLAYHDLTLSACSCSRTRVPSPESHLESRK